MRGGVYPTTFIALHAALAVTPGNLGGRGGRDGASVAPTRREPCRYADGRASRSSTAWSRNTSPPPETMDGEVAAEFEQQVHEMYDQMARIAITPEWVRYYDFGAGRMSRFLQEMAERNGS